MFVISLTYKAPIEEVDRHLDAHLTWLRQGDEKGMLIASGRKVPRTGGVLLARGERSAVEAFAAADPFVSQGVADCEITEVAISIAAPGFEALKG